MASTGSFQFVRQRTGQAQDLSENLLHVWLEIFKSPDPDGLLAIYGREKRRLRQHMNVGDSPRSAAPHAFCPLDVIAQIPHAFILKSRLPERCRYCAIPRISNESELAVRGELLRSEKLLNLCKRQMLQIDGRKVSKQNLKIRRTVLSPKPEE